VRMVSVLSAPCAAVLRCAPPKAVCYTGGTIIAVGCTLSALPQSSGTNLLAAVSRHETVSMTVRATSAFGFAVIDRSITMEAVRSLRTYIAIEPPWHVSVRYRLIRQSRSTVISHHSSRCWSSADAPDVAPIVILYSRA